MAKIVLDTAARTEFGKGASRRIRREGRVPGVVYGSDTEVAHISVPGHDLMMALKKAGVVLELQVDGDSVDVAPRQVQKDPVTNHLEHVDFIVLSQQEVRERLVVGAAVAKAEKAAVAEDLDTVTVVMAVRELLDEGLDADEAIPQAIERVKEEIVAQAAAAAAAAAAEEAAEAAAAEDGGEEAGDAGDAGASGGDDSSSDE